MQQHDDGLFVSIPALPQHLAQKTVPDRKKLRTGPLGVLADFLGFGRKPVVEQSKRPVGVDQLFGIIVVGLNLSDAEVLLQFQAGFGQVVQPR